MLAQGIYDEFQTLVGQYGPESIGNLMPLVVNVLENLDSALADNKDYLTALEETNEENQQLIKQFQKEKQRRKEIEEVRGQGSRGQGSGVGDWASLGQVLKLWSF